MAAKKTAKKATTANPFTSEADKDIKEAAPALPKGKGCQTCGSERVADITGKSVDLNNVQIGTKDDEEKPRFAGLRSDQRMDTITLEEALEFIGRNASAIVSRQI